MSRYKVEISGITTSSLRVLSNEEMKELFLKLQAGDESAKEKLMNGNLKLVLSIVQRFSSRCENMDDLFQVGCIGLIKSIDHFDLKHEDNSVIRISRHLKDLAYKAMQEKERYLQQHQQEPSNQWLAEKLQVKVKDIEDAFDSIQSVLSIYEPIYNHDGDELYLIDQVKDEHDEIGKLCNIMTLRKSMRTLSEKESDIIRKRYFQDMTQVEIAQELGISQAQVSRLEKNAIAALKKQFE